MDLSLPKVKKKKNFKIRADFGRAPKLSVSRWAENTFQLLFVEID